MRSLQHLNIIFRYHPFCGRVDSNYSIDSDEVMTQGTTHTEPHSIGDTHFTETSRTRP